MHPTTALVTDSDLSMIKIVTEIARSDASSIFEIHLVGQQYASKLFHDNGHPGYTENGRDLNRFRCEFKAYKKLFVSGACESGFIPKFYGYIGRLDPTAFHPTLNHFAQDKFHPRALLLEYLPNAEKLNCVKLLGKSL